MDEKRFYRSAVLLCWKTKKVLENKCLLKYEAIQLWLRMGVALAYDKRDFVLCG